MIGIRNIKKDEDLIKYIDQIIMYVIVAWVGGGGLRGLETIEILKM